MGFHYLWNTPTEWTFTTFGYQYRMGFQYTGVPLQSGLLLLINTPIEGAFTTYECPYRMDFLYLSIPLGKGLWGLWMLMF